ncbi:DUF4180 domain-containing protein [Streptomyces sp. NPDC092296]|uniref:DUF4180 domain-containing protein n=1 Tax=Streptomyces sp. NPDC092296 TaxID=3366012 RepID=UPI003812FA36
MPRGTAPARQGRGELRAQPPPTVSCCPYRSPAYPPSTGPARPGRGAGNCAPSHSRRSVTGRPAARLTEDLSRLSTRVAGDIVQKFADYRLRLAIVGDVSRHTEAGGALRDFVRESNRGAQLWFLPDTEALRARHAPPPGRQ